MMRNEWVEGKKARPERIIMEAFEQYRPLLFAIAYRMTGCASEAEDIVQETYLRSQIRAEGEIQSLKSYLSTIVTHLCLDYLKSARVERELYIGAWLPQPVLTRDEELLPLEQRESISLAFLVLLETLTPPERAVFLLHEVFEYPFQELGEIVGKSQANCRQIFHRAKQAIEERRRRFEPSPERQQLLIASFIAACQLGDLRTFTTLLAQDASSWSDGGGKIQAPLRPIRGRSAVARYWTGMARKDRRLLRLQMEEFNGQQGVVVWEGATLISVIALMATQEGVQEIYAILNPEKLVYIQRQLESQQRIPQNE
jgi:RNA polymerase sigma-70 factor, ECF subfamily